MALEIIPYGLLICCRQILFCVGIILSVFPSSWITKTQNQIWLGSIIIKEKEMCTPLNLKTATNFFFHRCEDSRLWRMKCLNKILLLSLHSNLGKDHISIVCEASELSVPLLAVCKRNTQGFCFYSYNLNLGG